MAKSKVTIERPIRDPDYVSKRGVPYWWASEWCRGNGGGGTGCGKIAAVKEKDGSVNLYMKSREGNYTYIQGSIQREFQRWHTERQIDYILLGMDLDDLIADEYESADDAGSFEDV